MRYSAAPLNAETGPRAGLAGLRSGRKKKWVGSAVSEMEFCWMTSQSSAQFLTASSSFCQAQKERLVFKKGTYLKVRPHCVCVLSKSDLRPVAERGQASLVCFVYSAQEFQAAHRFNFE